MLAEHAAVREEFEQRLAEIWRPAVDLFEMVSVSCLEAGFDLYEAQAPAMIDAERPDRDQNERLHAMTLLHARACMVASEVHASSEPGTRRERKHDGEPSTISQPSHSCQVEGSSGFVLSVSALPRS